MTKIDIISGFLGAGKTTLIKKLLSEALGNEKVLIIENEFGEIGIDGGFLNETGIEIKEMNSGCICCSLVGDFKGALKEALEKYKPERIIIEPSGVGKLSDVIKAVSNIKDDEDIKLNSLVAVVNSLKYNMYMANFGEFFCDQIENANTIILSRSQKLSDDKLNACVKAIKEHNSKANIITTSWEELEGKQILSAIEDVHSLEEELKKTLHSDEEHLHHDEDCQCGCHDEHEHHHHHQHEHDEDTHDCHHDHDHHEHHHDHDKEDMCSCHHEHEHEEEHEHHHHHADEVFETWGIETPKKFSTNQLENILKELTESKEYGLILRAKGIVQNVDGSWINFDLVPGEHEIRKGKADYTGRLCVIGSKLEKSKLENLFI